MNNTLKPLLQKSHELGYGFYHLAYDGGKTKDFENMAMSDFVNTFLVEYADQIDAAFPIAAVGGCKLWTTCQGLCDIFPVGEGKPAILRPDWKQTIDRLIAQINATGCYDAWQGFYFDEPMMWLISNDMLHTITQYMHESAPDKRIFVVFCISRIDMNAWATKGCEEINAHGSAYLTDVAYDLYHEFDDKEFTRLADRMKSKLANPNTRIWYIPGVMELGGIKSEQMALEHVRGLLKLLKKEKNPGGLMNFTYYFVGGDVDRPGISEFVSYFDDSRPTTWPAMKELTQNIGRAFCEGRFPD